MDHENALDITLNLNKICRVCLLEHKTMNSIYSQLRFVDTCEESKCIYDLLTEVSSIKVNEDDGLPNLICLNCIENAHVTYNFKKQCNKSQLFLEKYLIRTQLSSSQSQSPSINNDDNCSDNESNTLEKTNFEAVPLKLKLVDENLYCDKTIIKETNDKTDSKKTKKSKSKGDKLDFQLNDQHCKVKLKNNQLVDNTEEEINFFTKIDQLGAKTYKCSLCEKKYKHGSSLRIHMRLHTNTYPYICKMCGKAYSQYSSLAYHHRNHAGERPYACKLCDKKYRQAGTLTAHMRVHTGQRPFLCSICGRGFRQAPDLNYHMRTHTKEKRYMCNICGKTMRMQCHLAQHMRSHTGERPFKCSVCNKTFPLSTTLKRHSIIHTDLKPYTCEVCNKSFNRSSSLRVHSKTHSTERPYICRICNKGFIQAHALKSHMRTHSSSQNVYKQIDVSLKSE